MRKWEQRLRMAQCPKCGGTVKVPAGARRGFRIECPECFARLEVIGLRPLELDYALDTENWTALWGPWQANLLDG